MSKLEKLIQQYCPDGVEYVKLGNICNIKGRIGFRGYTRDDQVKEGEGALSLSPSNIQNGQMDYTKGTFISWEKYNESPEIITYDGDIIFCKTASVGKVALVKNLPYAATINPQLVVLKDIKCNAPFLTHVLGTDSFQKKVISMAGVGSVPNIPQKSLADLEIPLPPLPVQDEIVRILDAFTELQAELQAELQKRQQQYNFYRDTLLTNYASEQNVKEYCLGELFEFKNGLNASKEQFGHGKPIVNYVNVYKKNSIVSSDLTGRVELDASTIERFRVKRGDVFFTRTSETREEVGFASVLLENIEDCVFSGFVLRARPITNVILPEFCKYCFATYEIRKQIIQSSTLTTRALTNGTSLSKVKIMIPPLEEQNRIVAILDRFDTLTNDLTSGLPAEMEKRRQQYEYYRDRLLTFKRL